VIIFPVGGWTVASFYTALSADSMAKIVLLIRGVQQGGGKAFE
jgi:hypothetical protein